MRCISPDYVLIHEKEKGLYHMQLVSGVSRRAYWGSFFLFDLMQAYASSILVGFLFEWFDLKYK